MEEQNLKSQSSPRTAAESAENGKVLNREGREGSAKVAKMGNLWMSRSGLGLAVWESLTLISQTTRS
jgi:hypothetical protein